MFHIRSAISYGNAMGTKRFDSVFDYTKWGCDIAVSCRCGHKARLETKEIMKACVLNGLDTRMPAIRARLKCKACGSREVRCAPVPR